MLKCFIKEFCKCTAIAAVLAIFLILLTYYLDTKNCLCSVLTYEERIYPFDERLSRVVDLNTVNGSKTRVTLVDANGFEWDYTVTDIEAADKILKKPGYHDMK